MKLISEQHIASVERINPEAILWGGKAPPLDDEIGEKVYRFLKSLHESMSLGVARKVANLTVDSYGYLVARSPWFCRELNKVALVARDEMVFSALQRATGHIMDDGNGGFATDAEGKVVRKGGSDMMAKYFLEAEERSQGIGVGVGTNMVTTAADDALTQVRRQYGLLQARPWSTVMPDGSWVLEIGQYDAYQLQRLSGMGITVPNISGLWFIQVASATDPTILAIRDQHYQPINNVIQIGVTDANE